MPADALREAGVAEVMTSTYFDRHPTALHATGLPILRVALDVERMTAQLEPLLRPLGDDASVQYAKLVDYKRGNRGLVRYNLRTASGSAMVVGKLYPAPDRMLRVHAAMEFLWDEVFGRSAAFGVPRPLGYVRELSMLVYVPAEGLHLDELLPSASAAECFAQTGRWLATLHASRLPLWRRFDFEAELVHLQAWAVLVGHGEPSLAMDADRLSQALRQRAQALRFVADVPLHKDFQYRHVVVGDGLCVIDFDEMRMGDPNCDLAHFCANLDLLALRTPDPARVATLAGTFLAAYREVTGWTADARFDWFHAYTCLKIAKQLCTTRGPRPRPSGEEQGRQMKAILARGLQSVEGR
ncbi:MAG: phosphotransferase family protein [Egibacteraceae bacterium]